MKISLISGPEVNSIDIAVGSARTCYSAGLKTPESITNWEKKDSLALDLLKSGHHTTLQHANFTFAFEGVSRLAIWRFFHSHRFYNSDQVSQRYAKIDTENFYVDKNLENKDDIFTLNETLIANYLRLTDILEEEFKKSTNKVHVKIARKMAMENARYVLPQSILANMYHTINISTLLRYYSVSRIVPNATNEIKEVIEEMVRVIIERYPEVKFLFDRVEKNLKDSTFDYLEKIDKKIFKPLAKDSFCEIMQINDLGLGFTGDYGYYSDTAGSYSLFSMPESNSNFTTKIQLSLSADAQNQRHRTSIGLRPNLEHDIEDIKSLNQFLDRQYIPEIFYESEEAMDIYLSSMKLIYETIENTDSSYVSYILPNSYRINIIETTNFSDFAHKAKMRLCLNAQEEIRYITENMVESLSNKDIDISLFVPPCVSRSIAGIKPICSEGDRFCGVKEWKKEKYSFLTK